MERAHIFLPFIKEEVAKRNLPPELAYLPIIESSFNITARSRSGAVGLWQFMMNSISPYDIKVNDFIDERRDFIKSTRGALQKLEDNYRSLGSWELSLAAYNAGLGGISRTVQRTGRRDYWELAARNDLKSETLHYVPKLIAVSYVLSQPRKYGINIWQKKFEWTAVPLHRQISLDIIAQETGIDRELLRRLNAQVLRGITPMDRNFNLIIPADKLAQVNEVLAREDLQLLRYHYHIVRHGDTLWSMSRHYGAALNLIEQFNPGISNRFLKIGETVVIPALGEVTEPPPLPASPIVPGNFVGSYLVQSGDTIWSIARRYGIDPQVLAAANNMRMDQILSVGRTLKVPIN
jgi:membrane-bound lytic murein transglycosylase D